MSNFGTDLGIGLRNWFRSWSFIFSNGLAVYFLYPIIISILLSMGAVALIRSLVNELMAYLKPWFSLSPAEPESSWEAFQQLMLNVAEYAVSFVLWIAAFYTFVKISKYLILALMSPVMAFLSERTEEILTGKSYPFNLQLFVKDVFRGMAIAIRNLFVELALGWALLAIHLMCTLMFPPSALILSPLVPLLSFALGAYFYGFSTIDYVLERRRLTMGQSIRRIRSMKGVAIGNGALFQVLFYVPFVGVSIATITCTVGAVLAIRDKELRRELPLSE